MHGRLRYPPSKYWRDRPILDRLAGEGPVCFFGMQIFLPKLLLIAYANVSLQVKTSYDARDNPPNSISTVQVSDTTMIMSITNARTKKINIFLLTQQLLTCFVQ